jgi:hypothetical protein
VLLPPEPAAAPPLVTVIVVPELESFPQAGSQAKTMRAPKMETDRRTLCMPHSGPPNGVRLAARCRTLKWQRRDIVAPLVRPIISNESSPMRRETRN